MLLCRCLSLCTGVSHRIRCVVLMDRSCHGCGHRSSFHKWWLFHFHKGSGSSRSPLPASLFEHASIGQANNRTTQRTTQHCEVRALTPPSSVYPPHACHRQGTGQSPTARTRSRTWATLQRLRVSAILLCDMFLTVGHKDKDLENRR